MSPSLQIPHTHTHHDTRSLRTADVFPVRRESSLLFTGGTHVFHKRQRILQPSATKRFLSSLAIFSVLGSYLPSISEDVEALTFVSAYDEVR